MGKDGKNGKKGFKKEWENIPGAYLYKPSTLANQGLPLTCNDVTSFSAKAPPNARALELMVPLRWECTKVVEPKTETLIWLNAGAKVLCRHLYAQPFS